MRVCVCEREREKERKKFTPDIKQHELQLGNASFRITTIATRVNGRASLTALTVPFWVPLAAALKRASAALTAVFLGHWDLQSISHIPYWKSTS